MLLLRSDYTAVAPDAGSGRLLNSFVRAFDLMAERL